MFQKAISVSVLLLSLVASPLMAQNIDASKSTFAVKELPEKAGTRMDAIIVTAKGANGAALPNVTINASVEKGDADLSAASQITDTSGVAKFGVTTKKDNTVVVIKIADTSGTELKKLTLASPAAITYSFDVKSLPPTSGDVLEAIKITANDANKNALAGIEIKASVPKGNADISPASAPTGADGVATFKLTTKTGQPVVKVQINNAADVAVKTLALAVPSALVYVAEPRATPLSVHADAPDALKVTAKTEDGDTVQGVDIKASIEKEHPTDGDPDAKLVFNTTTNTSVDGKTDKNGVATFGVRTNEDTEFVVRLTPMFKPAAGDTVPFAEKVLLVKLTATSSFVTSLGSRKSYLQIFLGQTFKNTYGGEDPEGSNEFKNVGFGNSGQLVRLAFNTMWRLQDECPQADDCDNSFRHGLFHTDAHIELSKFPFGLNTEEEGDGGDPGTGDDPVPTADTDRGLENAFTGSLGLTWEPNSWTSYDKRDDMDLIPGDDAPYDAYRFGLFTKMGATTRAKSEPGGNTSINRIQFGLRFTHSRSKFSRPSSEERNEVPIRFVEMSFARFSDWGAGPTANDGAPRLVFDAGLRITALSNEVFPIYVGGHFNTGPGEDDLRLFIGMLVKLDLLGRLVQGVTGPPPKPK